MGEMYDSSMASVFVSACQAMNYKRWLLRESFESCLDANAPEPEDEKFPDWLQTFREMEGAYQNAICEPLNPEGAQGFASEMEAVVSGVAQAAGVSMDVLQVSGFESHLFYDIGLRQWLVMYTFTLKTTDDNLKALLEAAGELKAMNSGSSKRYDLHNAIRDAFCESDCFENVIPSVFAVQKAAKETAGQLYQKLYGKEPKPTGNQLAQDDEEPFEFPPSSTDLSFFAMSENTSALREPLMKAGDISERKENNALSLLDTDENGKRPYDVVDLFTFGGRFNNILINAAPEESLGEMGSRYVHQFLPILFHTVLIWSYLDYMTTEMQTIQRKMLSSNEAKNSQIQFFDALIQSIEYASFENETFRRGIERDNELVYVKIEAKWNINNSLIQMKDFASYLSECVNRDYQDSILKNDQKQNAVLNIIALLGVFGLMGLWNDLMSILGVGQLDDAYDHLGFLQVIIPDTSALLLLNYGVPVLALIATVVVAFLLFRRDSK